MKTSAWRWTSCWQRSTPIDASPQMKQRMCQVIPQGRLGKVQEYASLALYLASDDAAYMVGQVLSPNGGVVV